MKILAILLAATAGTPSEKVGLEAVLAAAVERPALRAARAERDAAEADAQSIRRLTRLPTVDLNAGYWQTEPRRDLKTPFGPLPQGGAETWFLNGHARQPLFDPANSLYNAPAAALAAEASARQSDYTRQRLAAEAGQAFVDVLRLEARLKAARAFIESLEARSKQVRSLVDEGRALNADLLKINLRRDDAKLDAYRLRNRRAVATFNLGRAVGRDEPVEPAFDPGALPRSLDFNEAVLAGAVRKRPDLAAISLQVDALGLQAKGVRAEGLPRLDAELDWRRLDPSPFTDRAILEARIAVSWRPFASGTRKTRAAAVRARQRAAADQLTELRRGAAIEIRQALADFDTAKQALAVRARDVIQARETLRVETARYLNGRATLNDVLEFEALLRERNTLRDLAELDILAAWIDYRLAAGLF